MSKSDKIWCAYLVVGCVGLWTFERPSYFTKQSVPYFSNWNCVQQMPLPPTEMFHLKLTKSSMLICITEMKRWIVYKTVEKKLSNRKKLWKGWILKLERSRKKVKTKKAFSIGQIIIQYTVNDDADYWQMCPRHETRHFICVKLVRLSRTGCCHLLWLES